MKTLIIASLMLSATAKAAITTTVNEVLSPEPGMSSYEVLASDGRVYEIDENNIELAEELQKAKETGATVSLELEEGLPLRNDLPERILKAKVNEVQKRNVQEDNGILTPMSDYEPSDLENLEEVTKMFGELRERTKWFSQCFNRAHIWAKQMHQDHGVKSQKILIYYTKKYRREVSKKWWFHIAPVVTVKGEKYVMDKEFTRKPTLAKDWEAIFTSKMGAKNIGPRDYRCAQIENISEYYDEANTQTEFCNIQYTSMYYWEPNDMSRLDKEGTQKTDWVDWEIRAAAKEAFKGWRSFYKDYQNR